MNATAVCVSPIALKKLFSGLCSSAFVEFLSDESLSWEDDSEDENDNEYEMANSQIKKRSDDEEK